MKKIVILPLFFFLFLSIPSLAISVNITPIADTWAYEYNNNTNYAYDQDIWITTNDAPANGFGYFMFDTSIIPPTATITGATLNLVQQAAGAGTFNFLVYNTSLNWNETNLTWLAKPENSVLQSNFSKTISGGAGWWPAIDVTNAVQSGLASNKTSLMIRFDILNKSSSRTVAFYNSSYGYAPGTHLKVNFIVNSSGIECNTSIIGTYCDPNDLLSVGGEQRTIITSPDYSCQNDKVFLCPIGDICSQITPQADIFTPITEYNVGCGVCWFVHAISGQGNGLAPTCPASKGFTSSCLWTNCPNNPECECAGVVCNGVDLGLQNITSIPATSLNYSAGCFNPLTGAYDNAVLANGTNSTITDLSKEIFGNTTNLNKSKTYTNTSTTCFDAYGNLVACASGGNNPPGAGVCVSGADQVALMIGSLFGILNCTVAQNISAIILSMIISIAIVVLLGFYAGISGKSLSSIFTFSMLIWLVMFTMAGWFPTWLIVILIITSALVVSGAVGKLVGV